METRHHVHPAHHVLKSEAIGARHAQQRGQLMERNQHGRSAGESTDDWPRQEMHQKPKLEKTHGPLGQPHHQCKQNGQGDVWIGPCGCQSRQSRGHQQAVHGHGAHRQMPRGSPNSVDDCRHQCGVQSLNHRQARDGGVGHPLGHEHDADSQSCLDIVSPHVAVVAFQPRPTGQMGKHSHPTKVILRSVSACDKGC